MKIKLYGVRGSCPTPVGNEEYRENLKNVLDLAYSEWKTNPGKFSVDNFLESRPSYYSTLVGGNTTCVSVTSKTGDQVVIDCGTGMRAFGNDLLKEGFLKEKKDINILITHTHWDHIQGWPFFKLAYIPGIKINFYSCIENLKERLERQQHPENFPLAFSVMASEKNFHLQKVMESFKIGSLEITPFYLTHPGTCIGYKITEDGKTFLFCTDVEFSESNIGYLNEIKPLLKGAKLIIMDAQYNADEARAKIGWGHTSVEYAVRSAEMIEAEILALTHHEPDNRDATIYKNYTDSLNFVAKESQLKVVIAKEGMIFDL
ncbi:MAG: MBL fold metallo-hydrolase [Leptospira sp.]|nr:MBL fold metallo-hydrolase [Leptospira sp.]